MRNLLAVIILSTFLVTCGGSASPEDTCRESAATVCNKLYTCYTGAELDALKTLFGPTEAACTTMQQAKCATAMGCKAGETYHSDKASECMAQYKALTCAQVKDTTSKPAPACDQVCTM